MARPLPEDLEQQIAGAAKRSEIRSVAIFAFALGASVGFSVAAAMFLDSVSGIIPFVVALGVFILLWALASRRK